MKVGDLVRVRRGRRVPKNGIVIRVTQEEPYFPVVVVQPNDGGRQIYVNPVDVRVLSENR